MYGFGHPCKTARSHAKPAAPGGPSAMQNHDIPDKVTVYCDPYTCGNHSHTFRKKCWLTESNGDKMVYVHSEEAHDEAGWLQEGDALLASNVDDDGNREYVADYVITSIETRNPGGKEMLLLRE